MKKWRKRELELFVIEDERGKKVVCWDVAMRILEFKKSEYVWVFKLVRNGAWKRLLFFGVWEFVNRDVEENLWLSSFEKVER